MATSKYIQNGELTDASQLTPEFTKKCTFNVGVVAPVNIPDDKKNKGSNQPPPRKYYQKFIDVTFPDGAKNNAVIIPNCVVHHSIKDYYNKPSVFVGIPQSFTKEYGLKLGAKGVKPVFGEKNIMSDDKYWWLRHVYSDAEKDKEYIRTLDDEGELYFNSFNEFFDDYPTSVLANVTCKLRIKTDVPEGEELKGNEVWRASITPSMFQMFDAIDVPEPTTTTGPKSIAGDKDKIRPGLARFRRKA